MFNIEDIEIVLRHLFHSVNGHVVVSEQNLLSDSINNTVRHAGEFTRKPLVRLKRDSTSLRRTCSGQQSLDLADYAGNFFLVCEGDHEEFVALVETDHAVRK